MLLRHTTAPSTAERTALTINPAKTCQPVGAMYASLGIHNCLPHSHGSQGCCAYHRSALTRHYKDPVLAGTSSFTEGSSVFGGQANLLQAIDTIFTVYSPDVIAVHTTCLSETIGDDVSQIVGKAVENGKIPKGKDVFHASTPSYVGSHITGFSNMTKAMADFFTKEKAERHGALNIIPGWMEPADMREIKRIIASCGQEAIMFPDTSGVFDTPLTGKYQYYPQGGVTVPALRRTGGSQATLALGPSASDPAAKLLDNKWKVPFETLELPIGIRAVDRFVSALLSLTGKRVSDDILYERGRLVDLMSDMSQYFYNKRVALWGDPDQLVSLTEFLADLDMRPVYIVTGTPGRAFETRIRKVLDGRVPEVKVKQGANADMFLMHQWIKEEPVDLLIGNTYGKYISRDENIPFVRHGFPIFDRTSHQYFPTAGYMGAIHLLDQILEALLNKKDREVPEESFELVM
jgi:nitrogenase molybdenum-iron protein beta chain